MNSSATLPCAIPQEAATVRRIVGRTRGRQHGPVVRLMSPSDLGELLKPFVFLDRVDTQGVAKPKGGDYGLHPHSGIATLTWLFDGTVNYEDTMGRRGQISNRHMEWMRAGGGAWHGGNFGDDDERVRGFQLWVALPPELELGPSESVYLEPQHLQSDGPVTVLLGRYGAAVGSIESPSPMNYLSVKLQAGESWRYQPPKDHTVAWAAVSEGQLVATDRLDTGDMVAFEESEDAILFQAGTDTEFVLGSAIKHPHDLVLGYYSVHTNDVALHEGEARIQKIGEQLFAKGRLR
ncbi:pirin family protein [Dyella sp. Tek66A03]|uniref:pirin family protein n=1 Tax=Dyella sp. Tek66A03 TaxID=3458298 RepID=UPI00403EE721